jgi:hypothetical protein
MADQQSLGKPVQAVRLEQERTYADRGIHAVFLVFMPAAGWRLCGSAPGCIAEVSISIDAFWAKETIDTSTPPIATESTPVSAAPSRENPMSTFASFYFTMTQAG